MAKSFANGRGAVATLSLIGVTLAVFAQTPPGDTGATCPSCGTVRSVREIDRERPLPAPPGKPGAGMAAGDFPGGLGTSHPVGWMATSNYRPGQGWREGYVGAVGSPEMRENLKEKSWEIVIRLDNGKYQLVKEDQPPQWQAGDRVKVVMGKLVPER